MKIPTITRGGVSIGVLGFSMHENSMNFQHTKSNRFCCVANLACPYNCIKTQSLQAARYHNK